jgi:hypothetical protein
MFFNLIFKGDLSDIIKKYEKEKKLIEEDRVKFKS